MVHRERGVLVIRSELLGDFPVVSFVCAGTIVGQGCWAGELMVGAWCGTYVAVGGDLAAEAGDRTGYLEGGSG